MWAKGSKTTSAKAEAYQCRATSTIGQGISSDDTSSLTTFIFRECLVYLIQWHNQAWVYVGNAAVSLGSSTQLQSECTYILLSLATIAVMTAFGSVTPLVGTLVNHSQQAYLSLSEQSEMICICHSSPWPGILTNHT